MPPANILLVSNGYGEAAIAGYIASAIAERDAKATVEHFPLVGRVPGSIGPQAEMPSGGLIAYWNVRNLLRDARAGLFSLTAAQFGFLRAQRARDAVVAVGDVYCLAACLLFAGRPTIFVATAKSESVAGHSGLEVAIAKRAREVFARDADTAVALAARGVKAHFEGNLMMDGVAITGIDLGARKEDLRVAVLPGSRADAPANAAAALRRLALVAQMIAPRGVQAFIALAPSVDPAAPVAACERSGVKLTARQPGGAQGSTEGLDVRAIRDHFGDLLAQSDLALGQAGTANEQAAGMGLPVIASSAGQPGRVGWYRMRQQRLLGDALLVLPDDDLEFARGVVGLLADPARMQAMSATGRARMGGPGGSGAVAEAVLALASQDSR
ncbi:MAG: hypothetical protein JO347_07395 [Candidatus Eremiobacteraeota bacterium]|nr:hypothetical protein [Candidatus Eremiobacteraeota bacterium]